MAHVERHSVDRADEPSPSEEALLDREKFREALDLDQRPTRLVGSRSAVSRLRALVLGRRLVGRLRALVLGRRRFGWRRRRSRPLPRAARRALRRRSWRNLREVTASRVSVRATPELRLLLGATLVAVGLLRSKGAALGETATLWQRHHVGNDAFDGRENVGVCRARLPCPERSRASLSCRDATVFGRCPEPTRFLRCVPHTSPQRHWRTRPRRRSRG